LGLGSHIFDLRNTLRKCLPACPASAVTLGLPKWRACPPAPQVRWPHSKGDGRGLINYFIS